MIDSGVPISIRSRNKNSSLSSNNAMQNTVPQNNVSAPPKTTNETVPQNAASFSKTPIVQNVVPRAQQSNIFILKFSEKFLIVFTT